MEGKTTVVNVKLKEPCDVYVGRGRSPDCVFGNPFKMRTPLDRAEVLRKYVAYFNDRIVHDEEFRNRVLSLKGKRLGCFCRPESGFKGRFLCHAQVIAAWLEGVSPEEIP